MPTLADNIPNSMLALLIGPAGCGKTTFALQFRRPYLVNIDNNIAGPRNYYKRAGLDMSAIKYDNVALDDANVAIAPVAQYARFATLLARGVADKDVDTIIVDSTTSLQPVLEARAASKVTTTASKDKVQPTTTAPADGGKSDLPMEHLV